MPLQRILVETRYRSFIMYLRKMTRQDNIGSLPTSLQHIQPGNNSMIIPPAGNTVSAPRRPRHKQDGQK